LGCIGKASARPITLQGKKFTEEILHGNQEKGCEEEKETLTVLRDETSQRPKGFLNKSLDGEAPPARLFLSVVSRSSSVVSKTRRKPATTRLS
jgi:hypothetical protein